MYLNYLKKTLLLCGFCLALTGCKSAEERAADYFASSQELIENGDLDRAAVELRNLFELMPNHVEARRAMAHIMLENGNVPGAYAQYIRLIEQEPNDLAARTTLAELAFDRGDQTEFERHGSIAVELAPDAPRSQAIDLVLRYQNAIQNKDAAEIEVVLQSANTLLTQLERSTLMQQVVIDGLIRSGQTQAAVDQLNIVIAARPEDRRSYDQRLTLLRQIGDAAALEAHLRDVIAQFPEDMEAKSNLVTYLIATDALDGAEEFLRSVSDPADTDPALFLSLIYFLNEFRGSDATRQEIDRALSLSSEPDQLLVIRAGLDFKDGNHEKAVSELQEIIDRREPSDLTDQAKIILSRLLTVTGDEVSAERLVGEVLEANPDNVAALKIRAAKQIEADDPDGAVEGLRRALNVAPDDVEALTMMAEAYARAGSHDLMRDFLAQAVDVSGHAPEPTLRYARLLVADENYVSAEEILIQALRRTPTNSEILRLLGSIFIATEDFSRATKAADQLRQVGLKDTVAAANQLQVQILARQKGLDGALSFIEALAQADGAGLAEQVALLRARLSAGDYAEALRIAEELLAEDPENVQLRFLLANTKAATGDLDAAVSELRQLVSDDPERVNIWLQLYQLVQVTEGPEAASAVLEAALEASPDAPTLLWAHAIELERAGDIESAIAIYDDLYARNSGSVIFANNLASLLVTYKDDDANLQRAWTIARRLRDSDAPALQDTYGWLAYRRGDPETALPYLEKAATGLPQDAIVQYHLAEVYRALERPEEAIAAYQRALQISGDNDPRPQMQRAQEAIARLQAALEDSESE